jgi:hypothetical protein
MIIDTIDDWELQDTDDIDARLLSLSSAAKQQQQNHDEDEQDWTTRETTTQQDNTATEETVESIDAREEEARIQWEQQEAADRATQRLALEAEAERLALEAERLALGVERQREPSIVGPPIDDDVTPKMRNTKISLDNRDDCLLHAQTVGEYTNEHGNSILVMELKVGRIGRTKPGDKKFHTRVEMSPKGSQAKVQADDGCFQGYDAINEYWLDYEERYACQYYEEHYGQHY